MRHASRQPEETTSNAQFHEQPRHLNLQVRSTHPDRPTFPPDFHRVGASATDAVKAQLLQIKKALRAYRERAEAQARAARVGPSEILTCLKQAGHMTAPELLKALQGLAKSSLWPHVNKLERDGEVRIELTSRGSRDGRKRQVIWHRDAMLT